MAPRLYCLSRTQAFSVSTLLTRWDVQRLSLFQSHGPSLRASGPERIRRRAGHLSASGVPAAPAPSGVRGPPLGHPRRFSRSELPAGPGTAHTLQRASSPQVPPPREPGSALRALAARARAPPLRALKSSRSRSQPAVPTRETELLFTCFSLVKGLNCHGEACDGPKGQIPDLRMGKACI